MAAESPPGGGRRLPLQGVRVTVAIGLLLTLAAALRLHLDGLLLEPLVPYSDQTFQALLVERAAAPSAFEGDVMVEAIDRFWPDPYFAVLDVLSAPFADLRGLWTAMTLVAAFVLLTGVYRLARDLFLCPVAGVLAALSTALVPRDALIAEWGVVPVVPRFLTLVAAPWILHAVALSSRSRALLAFAGCGLLASVHTLSALQLFVILEGMLLLGLRRPRDLRLMVGGALAAGIGAVPALLALPDLDGFEQPDVEELRRTCFAYFIVPYFYKSVSIVTAWATLAAITVGAWWFGRRWSVADSSAGAWRFVCLLAVASVAVSLGHLAVLVEDRLLPFSPLRASKYLHLAGVLAASGSVAALLRSGGRSTLVGGLLALGLVLPAAKWASDHGVGRLPGLRGRIEASRDRLPSLFELDVDTRGREEETRRLADQLRREVAAGEVILAPPRGISVLRLFSRRAFYVAGEDSVVALYDAQNLRRLFDRLDPAIDAYATDDLATVRRLAQSEGCSWILVPEAWLPATPPPRARGLGLVLLPVDPHREK